jgi:hypothetical protein
VILGRRRRGPAESARTGRRTGPPDEERWWDPADQALVERPLLVPADFGPGWTADPMLNNAERFEPLADDADSLAIRAARDGRGRTGLDEGRAWRRRRTATLAVLRLEVFAVADERAHRAAWHHHAEASLDATWRARWAERGVVAGWIESRWVDRDDDGAGPADDAVDWIRIEDHTDPSGAGRVTVYEHLTVWAGRRHATLTMRHDLDTDVSTAAAAVLLARLRAETDRP